MLNNNVPVFVDNSEANKASVRSLLVSCSQTIKQAFSKFKRSQDLKGHTGSSTVAFVTCKPITTERHCLYAATLGDSVVIHLASNEKRAYLLSTLHRNLQADGTSGS